MGKCCRKNENRIVVLIEDLGDRKVYHCDCKHCGSRIEIVEQNKRKKVFKVVIAGGRDFNDYNLLRTKCDSILASKVQEGYNIVVISGTAKGADSLGEMYAKDRGYEVERYPADWDTFGKRAGYIRNAKMADIGDALIAFWNGSAGTGHMIDLAKQKGIAVRIVKY